MSFKERWLESLADDKKAGGVNLSMNWGGQNPEQHLTDAQQRAQLKKLEELRTFIGEGWKDPKGNKANLPGEVIKLFSQLQSQMLRDAATIKIQTDRFERLQDFRKQESYADLWEKIRLMIFRIATTIAVASVIFGAYYFANEANVPMPMLPIR